MPQKLDFFTLNEILLNNGAVSSPAELQGMLCGKLSGGCSLSADLWRQEALQFLDIEEVSLDENSLSLITELYQLTIRLLEDANFSFAPLLPGEEATIARRTEELGFWCQGFLHGIGTSGLNGDVTLSGDVADALRDLAQISQVAVGEEDDVNENEVYWTELVEYVKVAVLTVYSELAGSDHDKPTNSTTKTDASQASGANADSNSPNGQPDIRVVH